MNNNNLTILVMALVLVSVVMISKYRVSGLIALTAAMSFILAAPVYAGDWKTGYIPEAGKDTTGIIITNTSYDKDCFIRIHAYVQKGLIPQDKKSNPEGKEANCRLHVTMKDWKENLIWEGDINTGSHGKKLRLGPDHLMYKIYLRHDYSIHCWDVGHNCPIYWGIETMRNASFDISAGYSGAGKTRTSSSSKDNEVVYNNHRYVRVDKDMNFRDAYYAAKEAGGHLVTVTSKRECRIVEELVKKGRCDAYWVGGGTINGQLTWITRENPSYTDTVSLDGSGDCLQMIRSSLIIDDTPFDGAGGAMRTHGYVIEFE